MKNKDLLMLDIATRIAKQSYCKRSQVGAVLERDGRILATGYNGTLVGADNTCEDEDSNTKGCVVHTEQNIICFAARNGISTYGTTIYVTLSPCIDCAKLLVQAGISNIVYKDIYRDTKGLDLLRKSGVNIKHIETVL